MGKGRRNGEANPWASRRDKILTEVGGLARLTHGLRDEIRYREGWEAWRHVDDRGDT
jgi:hypothetical protein